jgi:general secretion pathway protein A
MILEYYNLREEPFGVTADPRYLYLSAVHREALATLAYGIRSRRGFMSLIAKPGMGKTTILFQLLRQLEGSARTVFLFQTLCSPQDLLRSLLRDLGVADDGGNSVSMLEQLNRVLLDEAYQGRTVVVVIDEAQNLEDSALELVRMLSNFETPSYKLMQIILSGQLQLRDKLASSNLLQLRQRMSSFARLHPFSVDETRLYMRHRLRVAGYDFKMPLFTPKAEALIAKCSEGIPRNINNICFNALSLARASKKKTIREEIVRECLDDLDLESTGANDRDQEPAERKLIAFSANRPTPASRPWFPWRTRSAVGVILLLQLLCLTGVRQGPRAVGPRSLLALGATARVGTVQAASVTATDLRDVTVPAIDAEPSTESVHGTPADETSGNPKAVPSTTAPKSPKLPPPASEHTSDPANLWAQVKNEDSDAAVDLARLYLQGTAVPQNCVQAKVLLLAASRKGNERAADLLSDYRNQCP